MFADELLDTIPEGRDRLDVFVETDDETILLVVVGHELKGVVGDVTEKLDAGLDAPVPFVFEHQLVAEEEAGLKSTHVTVADRVAVDDLLLRHLLPRLLSSILVDEIREGPVLAWNLAVSGFARRQSAGDLFKLGVEGLVVQEDPIVMITSVESIFHLTDRTRNVPHVAVSCKRHESGIHLRAIFIWRRNRHRRLGRRCALYGGRGCDTLRRGRFPLRGLVRHQLYRFRQRSTSNRRRRNDVHHR